MGARFQDFEHSFQTGMTTAERLMYTMYWVHNNIDYAAASKGYAYNAFVSHKGQCNTYNGLTVEMMCFSRGTIMLRLYAEHGLPVLIISGV